MGICLQLFWWDKRQVFWKLSPWDKRSLGCETARKQSRERSEDVGEGLEQEYKGLAAAWLELPLCQFCRLLRASAAGLRCISVGLDAGRADEHLQRCAQRLLLLRWSLLESKILNWIPDQPLRSLLCGWRFRTLSPPSVFVWPMLPIVTMHSGETLSERGITASDFDFSSAAIHSIWTAHQYHHVGFSQFNNVLANRQYRFKVKRQTPVLYNQRTPTHLI